jgi:thymidylate kinase
VLIVIEGVDGAGKRTPTNGQPAAFAPREIGRTK